MIMSIIRSSRNPRLPQLQPLSARYNHIKKTKQKTTTTQFFAALPSPRLPVSLPLPSLHPTDFLLLGLRDETDGGYLYGIAGVYSVLACFRLLFMHLSAQHTWILRTCVRSSVLGLTYRKLLRIRSDGFASAGQGKVLTIMTADLERFSLVYKLLGLPMAPFVISAQLAIGLWLIGPPIFAGVAVTLLMVPMQLKFSRMMGRVRAATALCTDKRVTVMSDVLHGMQGVKMSAWEKPLSAKIEKLRTDEVDQVRIYSQIKAFTLSFYFCSVALASYATIVAHVARGGDVRPEIIFPIISLFVAARLINGCKGKINKSRHSVFFSPNPPASLTPSRNPSVAPLSSSSSSFFSFSERATQGGGPSTAAHRLTHPSLLSRRSPSIARSLARSLADFLPMGLELW